MADRLYEGLSAASSVPIAGARDLPALTGLNPRGIFLDSVENVLARATSLLRGSQRIFKYGNSIVMETKDLAGAGQRLIPLRTDKRIEVGAEVYLANVIVCQSEEIQFAPPHGFTHLLLASEPLIQALPRIEHYSHRPVFDQNFHLCRPGWRADSGILVHGPEVEPILYVPTGGQTAISRLPQHLRTLLGGYCFCSDADVTNTVGMLLTGLLISHFIDGGKAVALVDGNQPDIGKTLLVRTISMVLDGIDPYQVAYRVNEEEMIKDICARMRESHRTVLLIDNCKLGTGATLSSPFIESYSTAAEVSVRILGVSATLTRPNDLIWALTMNGTRASPDLVSRSIPIQLYYDAGPTETTRSFSGPHPLEYARQHRLDILGELAGMVVYWNQQGRPLGPEAHRCRYWAQLIGGILTSAGFPEFLANAHVASATMNMGADDLAALAEIVIAQNGPFVIESSANNEASA